MALTRPASWTTYFSKNFLTDCDLIIYDDTNTKLLDKSNINSYFYKGVNSFVCSNYPIDEVELVVGNWGKVASGDQAYLTTKGNKVLVEYVVGGDGTSTKTFYVDDWEMDSRGFAMTIRLVGHLQLKTAKASVIYIPYTYATYMAGDLDTITTQDVEDYVINYVPPKITEGELLQNLALTMCCGFKYDDSTTSIAFIGTPQGHLSFNKINVRDVMSVKLSKDSKNVIVLGSYRESGSGYVKPKVGFATSLRNASQNWEINEYIANLSFTQVSPPAPTISPTGQTYNDHYEFAPNGVAPASYDVYADYVHLETTQEENYMSISSYLLLNSDTQKAKMKAYIEQYYAMDSICEFNCRIDPSIETLDCIYIDHKYIWVEEVDINFNGGYTGRIKGRIQTQYLKPIIRNITYDGNGHFTFKIYNPNPMGIWVNIKYSGGTATIYEGGTPIMPVLSANAELEITQEKCPSLVNSFNEKYNASLEDDVYVYFSEGVITPTMIDSDNAIVIEKDVE